MYTNNLNSMLPEQLKAGNITQVPSKAVLKQVRILNYVIAF